MCLVGIPDSTQKENQIMTTTATNQLHHWSMNYNFPTPFNVFMDLIGFSKEEFGENLVTDPSAVLGYLELDYLADSLKEYAHNPEDVTKAIWKIIHAESGEDETEEN